ncbi:MAG: rhomboid family intramembrane serine protease [Bacteroidales bacterium]|nr:rhomboid family intramembrane serine protease [Bacteroidales bacterium]
MITIIILIATAIISYIAFSNRKLFFQMQFNAYQIAHRKEYKRLITGVLIHADWGHLFFNMFAFFFLAK